RRTVGLLEINLGLRSRFRDRRSHRHRGESDRKRVGSGTQVAPDDRRGAKISPAAMRIAGKTGAKGWAGIDPSLHRVPERLMGSAIRRHRLTTLLADLLRRPLPGHQLGSGAE